VETVLGRLRKQAQISEPYFPEREARRLESKGEILSGDPRARGHWSSGDLRPVLPEWLTPPKKRALMAAQFKARLMGA